MAHEIHGKQTWIMKYMIYDMTCHAYEAWSIRYEKYNLNYEVYDV